MPSSTTTALSRQPLTQVLRNVTTDPRITPLARVGSASASKVILVARSRSSSGYFFCPMTVILLCHHCLHQTRGDSHLSQPGTALLPCRWPHTPARCAHGSAIAYPTTFLVQQSRTVAR